MDSSSAALGGTVMALVFGLVFLIIYVFIIRRVFKINKLVNLQKQQLDILIEIAIKQGVEPTVVSTILNRPTGL